MPINHGIDNEKGLGQSQTRRPQRLISQIRQLNRADEKTIEKEEASIDKEVETIGGGVKVENKVTPIPTSDNLNINQKPVVIKFDTDVNPDKNSAIPDSPKEKKVVPVSHEEQPEEIVNMEKYAQMNKESQNNQNAENSNQENQTEEVSVEEIIEEKITVQSNENMNIATEITPEKSVDVNPVSQKAQIPSVNNTSVQITDESQDGSNFTNAIDAIHQAKVNLMRVEDKVNAIKDDGVLWIPVPSLPSNGKVYDMTKSVFYRQYTYGDYEDINNGNLDQADRYSLILQGIKCTNLASPLLFPYCDFKYVSVLRRLEADGTHKFGIPYLCNTCGQVGTYNFTLDKIGFENVDIKIPVKVRLYSHPDEILEFGLPTIGDVITLLQNNRFYKKVRNSEKVLIVDGNPVIDNIALLSSCCLNKSYDETYSMLYNLSDSKDFNIINDLAEKLNPDLAPFEFNCQLTLPLTPEEQAIVDENNKRMEMLRSKRGNKMNKFMKYLSNLKGKKCGARNVIDISGGDVIYLPFRESEDDNEYGILSE